MATRQDVRFEDRILRFHDSGEDFERFVLEYFAVVEPAKRLVRSLKRRPDGAIDLYSPDESGACFIECKSVDDGSKTRMEDLWPRLERRLERLLLRVARGEGGAARAYQAWLAGGGLSEYRLCTSARSPNVAAQMKLQTRVADFFAAMAASHPALEHLARVRVSIWWWDHFAGAAPFQRPLFYRWFGGFPAGLSDLRQGDGAAGSFKRFLNSRDLPYFSRGRYLAERLSSDDPEGGWADSLIAARSSPVMVIFGPGGVGKTRLALEICRHLDEKERWWGVRVEGHAPAESLDKLLRSLASQARIVLFIDYGERCRELSRFVEVMNRLEVEGGHEIRMVISCRSGVRQNVLDELDAPPLLIDAREASPSDGDEGYPRWVVASILEYFRVPSAERLQRICGRLPVLAAFAAFLHQNKPEQFKKQFAQLVGLADFRSWADRRIMALESASGNPAEAGIWLAQLAIGLPLSESEASRLRNAPLGRKLFELLVADLWLETTGNGYAAAHDVFADALLARWLFGLPGLETYRAGELLKEALFQGRLDRALLVLGRLATAPGFQAIDGLALTHQLLKQSRRAVIEAFAELLGSNLLLPSQAFELVADLGAEVQEQLRKDSSAHLKISSLAEWAAEAGDRVAPGLRARFGEALAITVDTTHHSNIVVRRAYQFAPSSYEGCLLARLADEPIHTQSSHLIRAALAGGIPPATLKSAVVTWLEEHAKYYLASFVYSSWLIKDGDVDVIRSYALDWLDRNGRDSTASYVLDPLIEREGVQADVQPYVEAWLEANITRGDADRLLPRLMDYGQVSPDLLIGWLELHVERPTASYTLYKLAEAEGLGRLEALIVRGLACWGQAIEAGYILKHWLKAGKNPAEVSRFVTDWVDFNWDADEILGHVSIEWARAAGQTAIDLERLRSRIPKTTDQMLGSGQIASWLLLGGGLEIIEPHLVRRLTKHPQDAHASWAYEAWLIRKGNLDTIWPSLEIWLADHGRSKNAMFVYRAWLEGQRAWPTIRPFVLDWLSAHGAELYAGRLLLVLAKNGVPMGGLQAQMRQSMALFPDASYCMTFRAWFIANKIDISDLPEVPDAALTDRSRDDVSACFFYEGLLRAGTPLAEIEEDIQAWLTLYGLDKNAAFLIALALEAGGSHALYADRALSWIDHNLKHGRAGMVISAWLNAAFPIEDVRPLFIRWLLLHDSHPHAIGAYVAWILRRQAPEIIDRHVRAWLEVYSDGDAADPLRRACATAGERWHWS